MRFRKLSLLLLSVLLGGWGLSTPVYAASDLQQSQYEVTLTPPKTSLAPLLTGGDGALATTPTHPTSTAGGAGSTAAPVASSHTTNTTATSSEAPSQALTGRLPQLSEQQWTGLGLLSIILGLMFLAWRLSRKSRRS